MWDHGVDGLNDAILLTTLLRGSMVALYISLLLVLSVVKLTWARDVVTGVALSRTTSYVRAMIPRSHIDPGHSTGYS
ncbi:MAG: hypothetical protein DME99_11555 [Verrucomicrobia bacterium]|nr:MAG: hypothetical protein DME99_11555 [Verrucomicrobiota bacterium]